MFIRDSQQPSGINPFHEGPPEQWSLAAGGLLSVFASYFGDSWSLRQAHLMKMAIILLLPLERATILDLPRLVQDRPFRQQAAFRCPNEAVRQFWLGGEYDESWANKDMSPILYKLGALTTFPEVRRIFGQPVPRVSFSQIVNGGRIFILRAPAGVVGSEISDLLASLVVMRTQLECHRRAGHDGPRRFCGSLRDFLLRRSSSAMWGRTLRSQHSPTSPPGWSMGSRSACRCAHAAES